MDKAYATCFYKEHYLSSILIYEHWTLFLGYAINPDADGTSTNEYVGDRIGAEEAKGQFYY